MIVYGSSLSPYVRKVLAFATEKGVDLELKPTGSAPGQPDAEFLEASPLRKMPALRDGDFTLADSSAIIHYLEAKFPQPALIPADPEARGRTIWFEEYADTVLTACGGKMFFNRVVLPKFFGKPGDEEAANPAECEELPPLLDYLETIAPEPGEFLVGGAITLADIAIASPFANLGHLGCERDRKRHGRIHSLCRFDPVAAELRALDRARNGDAVEAGRIKKTPRPGRNAAPISPALWPGIQPLLTFEVRFIRRTFDVAAGRRAAAFLQIGIRFLALRADEAARILAAALLALAFAGRRRRARSSFRCQPGRFGCVWPAVAAWPPMLAASACRGLGSGAHRSDPPCWPHWFPACCDWLPLVCSLSWSVDWVG